MEREPRLDVALYLAGGVVWIAIGVAYPPFMLSSVTAAAYLLAVVWSLPALVRKLR